MSKRTDVFQQLEQAFRRNEDDVHRIRNTIEDLLTKSKNKEVQEFLQTLISLPDNDLLNYMREMVNPGPFMLLNLGNVVQLDENQQKIRQGLLRDKGAKITETEVVDFLMKIDSKNWIDLRRQLFERFEKRDWKKWLYERYKLIIQRQKPKEKAVREIIKEKPTVKSTVPNAESSSPPRPSTFKLPVAKKKVVVRRPFVMPKHMESMEPAGRESHAGRYYAKMIAHLLNAYPGDFKNLQEEALAKAKTMFIEHFSNDKMRKQEVKIEAEQLQSANMISRRHGQEARRRRIQREQELFNEVYGSIFFRLSNAWFDQLEQSVVDIPPFDPNHRLKPSEEKEPKNILSEFFYAKSIFEHFIKDKKDDALEEKKRFDAIWPQLQALLRRQTIISERINQFEFNTNRWAQVISDIDDKIQESENLIKRFIASSTDRIDLDDDEVVFRQEAEQRLARLRTSRMMAVRGLINAIHWFFSQKLFTEQQRRTYVDFLNSVRDKLNEEATSTDRMNPMWNEIQEYLDSEIRMIQRLVAAEAIQTDSPIRLTEIDVDVTVDKVRKERREAERRRQNVVGEYDDITDNVEDPIMFNAENDVSEFIQYNREGKIMTDEELELHFPELMHLTRVDDKGRRVILNAEEARRERQRKRKEIQEKNQEEEEDQEEEAIPRLPESELKKRPRPELNPEFADSNPPSSSYDSFEHIQNYGKRNVAGERQVAIENDEIQKKKRRIDDKKIIDDNNNEELEIDLVTQGIPRRRFQRTRNSDSFQPYLRVGLHNTWTFSPWIPDFRRMWVRVVSQSNFYHPIALDEDRIVTRRDGSQYRTPSQFRQHRGYVYHLASQFLLDLMNDPLSTFYMDRFCNLTVTKGNIRVTLNIVYEVSRERPYNTQRLVEEPTDSSRDKSQATELVVFDKKIFTKSAARFLRNNINHSKLKVLDAKPTEMVRREMRKDLSLSLITAMSRHQVSDLEKYVADSEFISRLEEAFYCKDSSTILSYTNNIFCFIFTISSQDASQNLIDGIRNERLSFDEMVFQSFQQAIQNTNISLSEYPLNPDFFPTFAEEQVRHRLRTFTNNLHFDLANMIDFNSVTYNQDEEEEENVKNDLDLDLDLDIGMDVDVDVDSSQQSELILNQDTQNLFDAIMQDALQEEEAAEIVEKEPTPPSSPAGSVDELDLNSDDNISSTSSDEDEEGNQNKSTSSFEMSSSSDLPPLQKECFRKPCDKANSEKFYKTVFCQPGSDEPKVVYFNSLYCLSETMPEKYEKA